MTVSTSQSPVKRIALSIYLYFCIAKYKKLGKNNKTSFKQNSALSVSVLILLLSLVALLDIQFMSYLTSHIGSTWLCRVDLSYVGFKLQAFTELLSQSTQTLCVNVIQVKCLVMELYKARIL